MLSGLEGNPLTIDLDSPAYQDPQALADYARNLLLAAQEPGVSTPYQGASQEAAVAVASAIADRATSRDRKAESFLIGRFLALSVRGRAEPVDITSPGWQSDLPTELAEAFDEELARLGEKTSPARTLIEALAWAKGPGLPWENIWVPVARALTERNEGSGQRPITDDDVRWLLGKAGAYCRGRSRTGSNDRCTGLSTSSSPPTCEVSRPAAKGWASILRRLRPGSNTVPRPSRPSPRR